jgi:hypothetical protein
MILLVKNSTYPLGLALDLVSLFGRYGWGSSPTPTWWNFPMVKDSPNYTPFGLSQNLMGSLFSMSFRIFSTFTLPQTHMGADPITNSVQLRQGSRFSNHGGN